MNRRVGIIALLQESNTFITRKTTLEQFEQDVLVISDDVRERLGEGHHEVGGFFSELDRAGIEAVPIFAARALPYGIMTLQTFEMLMNVLEAELRNHLPLDGVLVAPHGATVSEKIADVDGYWLRLVRKIIGPGRPIIGTLDPHANLSAAMVDATDALTAFRTNPHIDQRERGAEAARLMIATLSGEISPCQVAVFPPMAINIECQQPEVAPCLPIYQSAARFRERPSLLSASICLGFPYADVPEMGAAILAVADRSQLRAADFAVELGEKLWAVRFQFQPKLTSVQSALDFVELLSDSGRLDRPVCLLDMGDNIGGGSPGDGTILAHAINERRLSESLITLCDPIAVEHVRNLEIGTRLELTMGARTDDKHGTPLTGMVTVVGKSEGRFVESRPRHGGFDVFDQGSTAVVYTDQGLTIMLTSRRMAPFSLEQLRHCGLVPSMFKILVAKGVHAPVAAYREVCHHFVRVNTPGVTSADLSTFEYRHRRRPMFPFEPEAVWNASRAEIMA